MLPDVAWFALHGGAHGDGAVAFETVLASLVAVLVLVGTLYYVGALEPAGSSGEDGPDTGLGD